MSATTAESRAPSELALAQAASSPGCDELATISVGESATTTDDCARHLGHLQGAPIVSMAVLPEKVSRSGRLLWSRSGGISRRPGSSCLASRVSGRRRCARITATQAHPSRSFQIGRRTDSTCRRTASRTRVDRVSEDRTPHRNLTQRSCPTSALHTLDADAAQADSRPV